MAVHHVKPLQGAVALPTGFGGVFRSFNLTESVASEDVTSYGAAVYGAFVHNGTPVLRGTVGGFVQTGAASTNPGFAANTDTDGAASTFTFETGTTLVGSCIITSLQTSHDRGRGAVPATWEIMNSGDMVATWASS